MNNYLIEIEETLSKSVSIKAKSKEEALQIADMLYDNEKIVLDDTNFVDHEIKYIMIDNENDYDYTEEDI
jgi:hypothetical protein